jgi:hypothetical protein
MEFRCTGYVWNDAALTAHSTAGVRRRSLNAESHRYHERQFAARNLRRRMRHRLRAVEHGEGLGIQRRRARALHDVAGSHPAVTVDGEGDLCCTSLVAGARFGGIAFEALDMAILIPRGVERTPGNTIRKVYLCRANITRLRPGDLLFFYMSKADSYAFSQSITTVGIVEQVIEAVSVDDLTKHSAKRSVFAAENLRAMDPSVGSPVKMIDFLLAGHIELPVSLRALVQAGIFSNRPPQSIAELSEERYATLKPRVALGFDL